MSSFYVYVAEGLRRVLGRVFLRPWARPGEAFSLGVEYYHGLWRYYPLMGRLKLAGHLVGLGFVFAFAARPLTGVKVERLSPGGTPTAAPETHPAALLT